MLTAAVFTAMLSLTPTIADLDCLARNIEGEAGGEPLLGKIAVAHVTMNRLKDGRFGRSVCEVVFADNQFHWTDRRPDVVASNGSIVVAWDVLWGYVEDPTEGALYFLNPLLATGPACRVCLPTIRIGNHVFYKAYE